jgi:hypothetical protein
MGYKGIVVDRSSTYLHRHSKWVFFFVWTSWMGFWGKSCKTMECSLLRSPRELFITCQSFRDVGNQKCHIVGYMISIGWWKMWLKCLGWNAMKETKIVLESKSKMILSKHESIGLEMCVSLIYCMGFPQILMARTIIKWTNNLSFFVLQCEIMKFVYVIKLLFPITRPLSSFILLMMLGINKVQLEKN